ncbi:Hypothetical Protein FCC1311_070522 [Hondaea fermentalgiana]|uniref:Uncharacterized protein n=1 Tax=Hondaea fermentalgiana TaxID=2315210 RepID=A0A2R5GIW2_9STRA|nr:Hypothetical Protein FCC1311_070522 [Hondaea fermentalgiana]|eukprot:GBG30832.1 Hypothetical Protein FCC1311_070522 [Hondaea fermentalgiana]
MPATSANTPRRAAKEAAILAFTNSAPPKSKSTKPRPRIGHPTRTFQSALAKDRYDLSIDMNRKSLAKARAVRAQEKAAALARTDNKGAATSQEDRARFSASSSTSSGLRKPVRKTQSKHSVPTMTEATVEDVEVMDMDMIDEDADVAKVISKKAAKQRKPAHAGDEEDKTVADVGVRGKRRNNGKDPKRRRGSEVETSDDDDDESEHEIQNEDVADADILASEELCKKKFVEFRQVIFGATRARMKTIEKEKRARKIAENKVRFLEERIAELEEKLEDSQDAIARSKDESDLWFFRFKSLKREVRTHMKDNPSCVLRIPNKRPFQDDYDSVDEDGRNGISSVTKKKRTTSS